MPEAGARDRCRRRGPGDPGRDTLQPSTRPGRGRCAGAGRAPAASAARPAARRAGAPADRQPAAVRGLHALLARAPGSAPRELLPAPEPSAPPADAPGSVRLQRPRTWPTARPPLPGLPQPGRVGGAGTRLGAWVARRPGRLRRGGRDAPRRCRPPRTWGADLHLGHALAPAGRERRARASAMRRAVRAPARLARVLPPPALPSTCGSRPSRRQSASWPPSAPRQTTRRRSPPGETGRTGIPVVDAGMRQLAATSLAQQPGPPRGGLVPDPAPAHGLPHRRAPLHAPPRRRRRGQQPRRLAVDRRRGRGPAALVPHLQPGPARGQRFDPDGDWVRRWVPELASVPGTLHPRALGDAGGRCGRRRRASRRDLPAAHRRPARGPRTCPGGLPTRVEPGSASSRRTQPRQRRAS